jgi:5'-nucleotidase
METVKILVSNDDGVDAPGIAALHRALAKTWDVVVVAPSRERSASSHSLTMDVPLRASRVSDDVVSVEGTPTDCVLLALNSLLDEPPDLLVSGVNRGPNVGDDVTYSGTVAAAMEGTLLGVPSIAVSLDRSPTGSYDFAPAAAVSCEIARLVLARGLPPGTLLNVNVPNRPLREIRGYRLTRLGKQTYQESVIEKTDPRGRTYYWIGGHKTSWSSEADTDLVAVADGYVSVTPIHLDLTDYRTLESLEDWPFTDADIFGSAEGAVPSDATGRKDEAV